MVKVHLCMVLHLHALPCSTSCIAKCHARRQQLNTMARVDNLSHHYSVEQDAACDG